MQTITRYLETLRGTVDGDELHGVIARTLRRHGHEGCAGPDCLLDLYQRLDAYARDALTLPSMRIRARLWRRSVRAIRPWSSSPSRVPRRVSR